MKLYVKKENIKKLKELIELYNGIDYLIENIHTKLKMELGNAL